MAGERKSPSYHYYVAPISSCDGPIRCDNCPVLRTYSRNKCELTSEFPGDTRFRGYMCPLVEVTREEFFAIKIKSLEDNDSGYREHATL